MQSYVIVVMQLERSLHLILNRIIDIFQFHKIDF